MDSVRAFLEPSGIGKQHSRLKKYTRVQIVIHWIGMTSKRKEIAVDKYELARRIGKEQ